MTSEQSFPCQRTGCDERVYESDPDTFHVEVLGTDFHCCCIEHLDWVIHYHDRLKPSLSRHLPPTEHAERSRA